MCTKSFLRLSLVIVFSISLSACQDAETEVIKILSLKKQLNCMPFLPIKHCQTLTTSLWMAQQGEVTLIQRLLV